MRKIKLSELTHLTNIDEKQYSIRGGDPMTCLCSCGSCIPGDNKNEPDNDRKSRVSSSYEEAIPEVCS